MTAQIPQTTLIPATVLAALQSLPPEQQQQVFDFVEFLAQQQEKVKLAHLQAGQAESAKQRLLGQHQGMGWISDSFNDPLPDEFWLGETAEGSLPT